MATDAPDLWLPRRVSRVGVLAVALGLAAAALSAPAPALAQWRPPEWNPWPLWYPSPDMNPRSRTFDPEARQYLAKMNCIEAARVLRSYGYRVERQVRCTGDRYTFIARRDGERFRVRFDPWAGRVLSSKPAG
jgi:hypothetical protein